MSTEALENTLWVFSLKIRCAASVDSHILFQDDGKFEWATAKILFSFLVL